MNGPEDSSREAAEVFKEGRKLLSAPPAPIECRTLNCPACGVESEVSALVKLPPAPAPELVALVWDTVAHYDAYRGKGFMPAPDAYALMVQTIERLRAWTRTSAAPETAAPTPAPTPETVTVTRAQFDSLGRLLDSAVTRLGMDKNTLWQAVCDWRDRALSSPVGETPEGQ